MANKFNEGDIVRVLIDRPNWADLEKGELVKIIGFDHDGRSIYVNPYFKSNYEKWIIQIESVELADDYILKELWKE